MPGTPVVAGTRRISGCPALTVKISPRSRKSTCPLSVTRGTRERTSGSRLSSQPSSPCTAGLARAMTRFCACPAAIARLISSSKMPSVTPFSVARRACNQRSSIGCASRSGCTLAVSTPASRSNFKRRPTPRLSAASSMFSISRLQPRTAASVSSRSACEASSSADSSAGSMPAAAPAAGPRNGLRPSRPSKGLGASDTNKASATT